MVGFYMQYLDNHVAPSFSSLTFPAFHAAAAGHAGLCRRRGWIDPMYEIAREANGYTCHVLVNGRQYQTDLAYESDVLAQENAAMRAFMVCRNFSVNGGMLARNGIVQGLPADRHRQGSRHHPTASRPGHHSRRSGYHSSSSSTDSFE